MRIIFFFAASAVLLTACNNQAHAVEEVQPGTLICNPINPSDSSTSAALTVKWTGNKIMFIDSNKFHVSGETFVFDKNSELWDSYCNERNAPKDEYKINYCSNAGKVSFFNGRILVLSGMEMKCRNVEQPNFK